MADRITPRDLHEAHRWFALDEVALLPGNPNQGDSASLEASIGEFGWVDGIVVHEGTVIAGNHRVELARAAGESGLPGYDLSAFPLDEVRRMAIALAHNHTTRAGTDDSEDRLIAFESIVRDIGPGPVMDAIGFQSQKDPADLLTIRDAGPGPGADAVAVVEVIPDSFEFDHTCVDCGFQWS